MRVLLALTTCAVAAGCGGAPVVVATAPTEIYGTVTSKTDGRPLESATLAATTPKSEKAFSAVADARGRYSVQDIPAGAYVVTVTFRDSVVKRTNIRVNEGKRTRVDVKIDPNATGNAIDPTPASPDK